MIVDSSLTTLLERLITLVTFGIASGLLLAVALQLRQHRSNRLLIVYSLALIIWSSLFLLRSLFPEIAEEYANTYLKVLATGLGITTFSYFVFITNFLQAEEKIAIWMARLSPISLAVGLIIAWSGAGFSDAQQLQPPGYAAIGIVMLYVAIGFWVILSSAHELAPKLRLGGLLIVAAYASELLELPRDLPITIGLVAVASLLMGWIILRWQLQKSVNDLADEIRVANRDLRQVVTDLATERSKSADLLKQLSIATRYSQYKNEFLNALGHKLRTPLNSIVGYSQLLESGVYGDLSEKQQDRLIKIQRNGETLLSLINDMLDLNKIDAGQLELNRTALRIPAIIDRTLTAFEQASQEKGVKIRVEIDPETHAIHGDEGRITQVVSQLVGNAIKFTPSGEIVVSAQNVQVKNGIAARFALPLIGWLGDGDWVVVQVTDTGIGIPPEAQSHIFDEFYQVDEEAASRFEGTGLGLAIAKKLVELHDGVIWVKSQPNQGSTFSVALRSIGAVSQSTAA